MDLPKNALQGIVTPCIYGLYKKFKNEVFYPLLSPCLQGEGQIRRPLIRLISFGSGVTV